MAGGWTPERRQRQAVLIQQWKPWAKSTGPRTVDGKKHASMNALKHGKRCAEVRKLQSALAREKRALRDIIKTLAR